MLQFLEASGLCIRVFAHGLFFSSPEKTSEYTRTGSTKGPITVLVYIFHLTIIDLVLGIQQAVISLVVYATTASSHSLTILLLKQDQNIQTTMDKFPIVPVNKI